MKKNNFSKIETIINSAKKGKMFILVDDENRENEGDLVFCGSDVTSEKINFMAKYGRGLICLAINSVQAKKLDLNYMSPNNQSRNQTAFTVSIESRKGVTTGISAADRATTIKAAVNKKAKADDIVQPGHVFPIKAQEGGVLTRAGHTEAGTDLAKLAGLDPSAVIVEIMNDDGTMARRADLEVFAEKHNLKIGTIADLIHYRNISEKSIKLVDKTDIESEYGKFSLHAYEDTINGDMHIALVKNKIKSTDEVLVRVQQNNTLQDIMGINKFGSRLSFSQAMKKIDEEGKGVILLLSHTESSEELLSNISFLKGRKPKTKNEGPDTRIVGVGAQILKDLGVTKIRLLGASLKYPLTGFDLEITEFIN